MKPFQRPEPSGDMGISVSRRRFFRQSGAAVLSTALLTSCDNFFDKIFPSKKDDRDKTLAFFGDSLVAGTGGSRPFGAWVGDALSERPIVSDGINGQVALSIAIRQGGIPLTMSVAGGKFDGLEPLRVTKLSNEFLSTPLNGNVYSRTGMLASFKCQLTRKVVPGSGEVYTVEPIAETGTETPVDTEIPDNSVFELEDAANLRTATQILWYGRNDMTEDRPAKDIKDAIKASIDYITEPRRYLVLGVLPAVAETKGTSRYAKVTAFNDDLALLYRDSYVAMTPPTDAEMEAIGYTPTTEDRARIEAGNFPVGMRPDNKSDEIHLNNDGYRIIANRVVKKIKDLKY
ncbi:SGNH/GDSL hydrolase family protein [Dyadobacter sp. CY261]|uniref:SGNH/GDSL hydrolase family protein n=1 Tax=Dyadobacter sp. CY261 TaxID=2907203 RepID=UPI001F1A038D|nr:SGNH/GDSL hydrolase family protein [Dyadobacter sp. CY261]MCF0072290.1 SGNH/GDSL hydrolase family protein [Dyadobacter sp. CY261]